MLFCLYHLKKITDDFELFRVGKFRLANLGMAGEAFRQLLTGVVISGEHHLATIARSAQHSPRDLVQHQQAWNK